MLRGRVAVWFITALCLFFAGILFGYFVAIPAALNFLLEFSRGIAVPMITLGKYISFFGALILVGGLVFEIPVFIGLLSDAEVLKVAVLKAKRHYAFLIIMILAAIITPTQDIFNMLLFAIPMILLYEIGIVVASKIERGKIASRE